MKPTVYVIGCGQQFQMFHLIKLAALHKYVNNEIVVFDRDTNQYNKISNNTFNIVECENEESFWSRLKSRKGGEKLTLVATPPQYHYQLAKKAIGFKSHVYIEKPMTMNYNHSLDLINSAKAADRQVVVGVQRRFETIYHKCLGAIKTVGPIKRILLQSNGNFRNVDPFFIESNLLPVGNGYHVCDTLVWFLQELYEDFLFESIHSIVQPWKENPRFTRGFDSFIKLRAGDSVIPIHLSASSFSPKDTVDEHLIVTGEKKEIQMRRWRVPRDSQPPELYEVYYDPEEKKTVKRELKDECDKPDRSAPLERFIHNIFNDDFNVMPSSGDRVIKTDELIHLILKDR